ncbi:follicle-stimulating hormone receptor-like [Mytilus edulis]|uniref:follicle-stimulating hormone receptor-like n=1 Tax=Mytilus edulis TaxID=6550 RepID=UPI0039F0C532
MKVVFILCTILVSTVSEETLYDCGRLCKCEFYPRDTIVKCMGAHIHEIPKHLPSNTTKLYFSGTLIRIVPEKAFEAFPLVSRIFFRYLDESPCVLEKLTPSCFDDLDFLKVIGITGCHRLHTIEPGVFGRFRVLNRIHILHSGLTSVPNFENFVTVNKDQNGLIDEIDLSNNRIEEIKEHAFLSVKVNILTLDNNKLRKIYDGAFFKSQVKTLQLQNNPTLTEIGENAFDSIEILENLDLSRTSIESLPRKGLASIVKLRLIGTKSLRQFPPVIHFSRIQTAQLYYPHHCCFFKNPEKQNPTEWRAYIEFQRRIQQECSIPSVSSTETPIKFDQSVVESSTYESLHNKRFKRNMFSSQFIYNDTYDEVWNDNLGFGNPAFVNKSKYHASHFETEGNIGYFDDIPSNVSHPHAFCGQVVKDYRQVICTPEPDAFNPCEDLMGYDWLRIFVWIIVLASLFGNSVVLIVLIKSRSKFNVTKFLMCNLAFADLMMGVYLLLLASIDAHTLNEYFNYAVIWQNEGGCQAAGFLTVFSCELSIFTLTIITLERWYAISHAIHLTKRLRIRQAMMFMAFGWLYALFMAHLPLVGISSYGHVSICLPMKVEDAIDIAYVVSLLVVNGVAFLCIAGCYINMYCKVRGSHANVRNNDASIAKRMAMLVFTNFACWAPIAFFGLTASAGLPLIDITNSKILLVFFYPLNSFANPYLYVIITKQFRKDLYILLGKYGICTERANRYRVTFTSNSRNSLANRNGIKTKCTSSTGKPLFSRSPSNSESNCSTSTFLHNTVKQPSIRISLPDCNAVDKVLNESSDGQTERRLRSPPPYVRSASEYVVFFPPPRRDSYPKYKYQSARHITVDTTLNGNFTDTANGSMSDDNPRVFQKRIFLEDSEQQYAINPIDEEILEEYETTKLADVLILTDVTGNDNIKNKSRGDTTDNECDEDSIQQTLLKHCTLRESPVPGMDRKCPSDSILSDLARDYNFELNNMVTSPSKSSPVLDELDDRRVIFE